MPPEIAAAATEAVESTATDTSSAEVQLTEAEQLVSSQGITDFSEAELRGETVEETADETAAKTETEETTKTETEEETTTLTTEEEETDKEAKATEDETANSEPEATKVPKGYVPLAAVHEARGEIRYLKEQLKDVQTQMTQMTKPPVTEETVEDDFEVLTDEQFEDLADDNPAQAIIYQRKLATHEANERQKADALREQAEFDKTYDSIIDTSIEAMEKVAPGIFDSEQPVQKELMEFADSLGFSEDLYYLTNPNTKIILPGESEPLLLGEQAASVLGFLVNAKTKSAPADTAELETKLRTEITAELMKKFKNPVTEEYRGLNQVAKSDDGTPSEALSGKVLTSAQLLKLTSAEYEAYLAGN